MLNAPLLAFDIETDTEDQHWTTGDRGLSYCTDITYLSLYDGERLLVLTAQPYTEHYTYVDADGVVETHQVRQRITKKADFEALNSGTYPLGEGVTWELDGTKYGALVHTEPLIRTRYAFSEAEVDFIRKIFQPEHMKRTLIAHNLVFDARQIFGKFGLDAYYPNITFWDTLVMEILGMWGPIKENALLEMAKRYFDIEPDTEVWLDGMKKQRKALHEADHDDILPYVAWDSVAAYKIYVGQQERPFYEKLDELIPYEQEYTRWCVFAAAKGIALDVDYARKRRTELLQQWEESLEALGLSVEEEAKTRKREWLEEYIFERIEHPTDDVIADKPFLKTGTGAWSFGADALKFYLGTIAVGESDEDEEWYDPRPELTALAEHKAVEAVLRRLEEFLRHAEYDGRIHSIIVGSALTGRSVSSAPNVQNINFEDFAGYLVADPDYVLIELDYSNAENWASAMYTRDNGLAHACAQQDFHSAMAARYFGERWLKADAKERKQLRFFSKRITFGTAYGMGAGKLARSLGITQEEAQAMLAAKDRAFPFVAESKARASAWATEKGWTLLWSLRRCQIGSRDGKIKGYTAHNTQMQGGVAEIVRRAITSIQQYLYDTGRKSYVATMIHDSLIIAMHVDEYRELAVQLIQMMGSVVPDEWLTRTDPPIRWLTDIDHGKNAKKWGLVVGREYPFPLDEYVNQWGFHRLPEGATEAPVWINQWGWGDQALERELSGEHDALVAPAKLVVDWEGFRTVIREASSAMSVQVWNGKTYDFPEAIALHEALEHKGQPNHLREFIHLFDRLEVYVNQYKGWKGTPK